MDPARLQDLFCGEQNRISPDSRRQKPCFPVSDRTLVSPVPLSPPVWRGLGEIAYRVIPPNGRTGISGLRLGLSLLGASIVADLARARRGGLPVA